MFSSLRKRVTSAHVIAVIALFVALGSGAYAGSKIGSSQIKKNAVTTAKIKKNAVTSAKIRKNAVTAAKMSEYTNSGLVKLDVGQEKILLERGPFRFTAACTDGPGANVIAGLIARNTGSTAALFESQEESNYADPVFDPGEDLEAFTDVSESSPYWFGEYYNMFSVTSADGKTSLYGGGNIGVMVLDADCVFQLYTLGR